MAQAWSSARRIAAALVKMRMPSTTTTPVDKLAAHADLIADEHDAAGDQHVGQEAHREDAIREDAFQVGSGCSEDGVDGCHDGDGKVRGEHGRQGWLQHESHHHSGHQAKNREHLLPFPYRRVPERHARVRSQRQFLFRLLDGHR